MKPFEIQSADLKLGGVTLQAGNTGVVIPGVTQATSYKVEEVEDTGDQDRTFLSVPMIIDYITAQDLNNNGTTSNRATFVAELEDDGKIDGIEVDNQGSYTSQESAQNNGQNMLAYIGSDSDPLVNWNFQDWVTIPFAPKMRAGEIETLGGGSGSTSLDGLSDTDISDPTNGQALVWDGENWINQTISGGSGNANTGDLSFEANTMYAGAYGNATGFINLDNGNGSAAIGTNNNMPLIISVNENDGAKDWTFGTDGNLVLPSGGDIKDSNGNSVLGSGSGGTADLGKYKIENNYLGTTNDSGGWGGYWMYIDPAGESNSGISIPNQADQSNGGQFTIYHNHQDSGDLVIATNAGQWHFKQNGKLQLPANGDIIDDGGNSVLGGGSGGGNDLAPELTKSNGNLVASTTLEFQGNMYGSIFDIDSGGNFDVWVNRVTGNGDDMTYVIGDNDDGKQFVYALGSSGSVVWKVGIDNLMGNNANPYGLKYRGGYLYVACQYYNNNVNQSQLAVIKLSAEDGSVATSWVMVANTSQVSYQPYDIDVDTSGRPVVAGRNWGESLTYSGIASQSGSGLNVLVINASDLDNQLQTNPWGSYSVHTDPNDSNAWYGPNYVNWFVDVPVETITGTGSGMTVDIRYMYYSDTGWRFDWCTKHTYGSGYNMGDQVKILGSSIGGTDGVNDIILSDNGWYMNVISTDAGVTPWTQACPEFVYSKVRFVMSQNVDFNGGNWDVRVSLNGNAFVWTPDWQHTFGASNNEQFYSVKTDASGNVYLLGYFELQESGVYHKTLAMKLDSNGDLVWQKYVETSDHWGEPGSIIPDADGNCFVIGKDNNGYALVTKLDTNGDLVWQSKQTNGNNWNNTPLGDIDAEGNIIVMGSYSTGNYVTSIQKISKTDGSLIWARYFANEQGYDMYEWYDEFTQQGSAVGNNIYYGGYCYDANDDQYVGFGFKLPTDGTGTGTYGRYIYSNDSDATWEDNTSNAFLMTSSLAPIDEVGMVGEDLSASTTVDAVGSVTEHHWGIGTGGGMTGVETITFADGTTQSTAYDPSNSAQSWTNGNGNTWQIKTYSSGANVSFNGGDWDACWFDSNSLPAGDNQLRGAIIQYHAYAGWGTIIGTIHVSYDYSNDGTVTHMEHFSGNSNVNQVEMWWRAGKSLYMRNAGNNSTNVMVQYTATLFYGSEYNC